MTPDSRATLAMAGRYAIFHAGRECGEERWRIEVEPGRLIVRGEQELVAPHPFPSAQAYRIELTPEWRPLGIEILWRVGARELRATHRAAAERWHVQIEVDGTTREQQGDFPPGCEVEIPSHLASTLVLAHRDFGLGGEHEFPVLRIGPPLMAVSPERMKFRCAEHGTFASPLGPVAAKRYVVSLPPAGEDEGYAFWADEDGVVLESYEGSDTTNLWMRLVELEKAEA